MYNATLGLNGLPGQPGYKGPKGEPGKISVLFLNGFSTKSFICKQVVLNLVYGEIEVNLAHVENLEVIDIV